MSSNHPLQPFGSKGGRKGRKEGRIRAGNQPKGHAEDIVRCLLPPSANRYWSCLPRGFSIRRANFRENVSRMPAAPHNCRFKGYNSKERHERGRASWTWRVVRRETKTGNTLDPWGFSWIEGEGWISRRVAGNGRITNALGLLTKWKLPVIFFSPSIFDPVPSNLRTGGFLAWRRLGYVRVWCGFSGYVIDENVCVEREILWRPSWLNRLWLINAGISNAGMDKYFVMLDIIDR